MIEKNIHIFFENEDENEIRERLRILDDYLLFFWNKDLVNSFIKHNNIEDDGSIKYKIVCYYGGFCIDEDYVFFKNIDIFLNYDFMAVYNGKDVKFFGSSKNNTIIKDIKKRFGKFKDEYLKRMEIKIVNPIYLYPEKKNNYYSVVKVNKEFMFGANKKDSPWVFDQKVLPHNGRFKYNLRRQYFFSDKKMVKNTSHRNILIVIAHPDDDILWFGNLIHKFNKIIKVLCATCYSNSNRRAEFKKIMERNKVDYEMWDHYNDSSYDESPLLKEKLAQIVKNHEMVFTHSLSGETGHPFHILLNKYLYQIVPKNLFVSNPYSIKNSFSQKKKSDLLIYSSQKDVIKKYFHITIKEDYLQIK